MVRAHFEHTRLFASSHAAPPPPSVPWLPKVIEAWEEPKHEEFAPRTAWSLFNAFTEVQKGGSPRFQMEGSLRLTQLFRTQLQLN
jgi:hypothetical protein